MKKILSIVETAYRATIEEQDDTVLWINHAMKNFGGDISILLSGNAVNYAVTKQNAEAQFAGSIHLRPPELHKDLGKMIAKGIAVYITTEDVVEHGLGEANMIDGIRRVGRSELPELLNQYDQIWHW